MAEKIFNYTSETKLSVTKEPMYRKMSADQENAFNNAFKILFAGDLILLEDQLKNAYDGTDYNFDSCFEYTRSYISAADFSIGVFAGPMAGAAAGFSNSNYGDGKKLSVNYPDSWAGAIMNAGFDYVTTAQNHALDKGVVGMNRTCRVLEQKGLDYSGTYTGQQEKASRRIKVIDTHGIKLAILTYTFLMNRCKFDKLLSGDLSYITSPLVSKGDPYYERVLNSVREDFEDAQSYNPDLIIVLPHWGKQFADYPSPNQLNWEKTFKELGADIILGDHTHSVQPVYIDDSLDKPVYTLYCPGNYANIYREHNGDCSALAEVYIDRNTKKIIGGSIIPMWTAAQMSGNYRPLPIYKILTDKKIKSELTTYDLQRVSEAQKHITKIMLGEDINIDFPQERYYFDEKGFMRAKARQINITDEMKSNPAYKALKNANNVCFVGDSITSGTRSGGVGWFEPLESIISGKIFKCGWGSSTTKILLNSHLEEIVSADADLFVIAVGTNDVRYRNEEKCAMTPDEYVEKLQDLRDEIVIHHPNARFMFIAPWTSTDGDKISKRDITVIKPQHIAVVWYISFDNGAVKLSRGDYENVSFRKSVAFIFNVIFYIAVHKETYLVKIMAVKMYRLGVFFFVVGNFKAILHT